MKPTRKSVQEVLEGLEGLKMLSEWQLRLVRDLRTKVHTILCSTRRDQSLESPVLRGRRRRNTRIS